MTKYGFHPMVILWSSYGDPMVRVLLSQISSTFALQCKGVIFPTQRTAVRKKVQLWVVENFLFWITFEHFQRCKSLKISCLHFYFGQLLKIVEKFSCQKTCTIQNFVVILHSISAALLRKKKHFIRGRKRYTGEGKDTLYIYYGNIHYQTWW